MNRNEFAGEAPAGAYMQADTAFRDPGTGDSEKLQLLARLFLSDARKGKERSRLQRFLSLTPCDSKEAGALAAAILSATRRRIVRDAEVYESRLAKAWTADARRRAGLPARRTRAPAILARVLFTAAMTFSVLWLGTVTALEAAHYRRGLDLFEQGDYAAAAAEFERAGDWKNADTWYMESLGLASDPKWSHRHV